MYRKAQLRLDTNIVKRTTCTFFFRALKIYLCGITKNGFKGVTFLKLSARKLKLFDTYVCLCLPQKKNATPKSMKRETLTPYDFIRIREWRQHIYNSVHTIRYIVQKKSEDIDDVAYSTGLRIMRLVDINTDRKLTKATKKKCLYIYIYLRKTKKLYAEVTTHQIK